MKSILAAMNRLTNTMEAMIHFDGLEPKRGHPLKCRCGRIFKKLKTWTAHLNADHPRWAKALRKKTHHDRVNVLLGMMRSASPRSGKVA